jgi:transposase
LPETHLVRRLLWLTEETLGETLRSRCVTWGGFSYDPVAMFSVLVYALMLGERSSRNIEERCHFDARFWYLLGDLRPDHSTLARFRRKLDADQGLDALMALVVNKAVGENLVKGKTVVVDGTKMPTSGSQWRKYLDETEEEDEAKAQEGPPPEDGPPKEEAQKKEEPPQAEKPKKSKKAEKPKRKFKAPFDTDARTMKTTHGEFVVGYNLQIAVDAENGIVVGAHASNAANDSSQLEPLFKEMAKHSGVAPRRVLTDKGFDSAQNLAAIEEIGAKSYVIPKDRKAPPFVPDEDGVLRCKAGHIPNQGQATKDGVRYDVYKVSMCRHCSLREPCGKTSKGHQREMNVQGEEHLKRGRANRRRCESKAGKRFRKIRGQTIELTNARLKRDFKMRRLHLKGLGGARLELLLGCIALNLQTILRKLWTPRGLLTPLFALINAALCVWTAILSRARKFGPAQIQSA